MAEREGGMGSCTCPDPMRVVHAGCELHGHSPEAFARPAPVPSPGAPDEVEALAVAIRDGVHEHGNRVTHWQALDSARAVLAAGYLSPAQVVEAQAQAWDEGLRFGQLHWATNYAGVYENGSPLRQAPNPYRADRLTREAGGSRD